MPQKFSFSRFLIHKRLNACQHFFFVLSISKTAVLANIFFLSISKTAVLSLSKSSIRMFILNCFNTISNFVHISWKVCKKIKLGGFALRWTCDPHARSRSVKVVLNRRSQQCLQVLQLKVWKIWLKVWVKCPKLKILPCKAAAQMNTIYYIVHRSKLLTCINRMGGWGGGRGKGD